MKTIAKTIATMTIILYIQFVSLSGSDNNTKFYYQAGENALRTLFYCNKNGWGYWPTYTEVNTYATGNTHEYKNWRLEYAENVKKNQLNPNFSTPTEIVAIVGAATAAVTGFAYVAYHARYYWNKIFGKSSNKNSKKSI